MQCVGLGMADSRITEEITNLTKFATVPAMVVSRMETLAFVLNRWKPCWQG